MIKYLYPEINNPDILKLKELTNKLSEVSQKHGIPIFKIKSRSRKANVVDARSEFVKKAYRITGDTSQIMQMIDRDRTSFYHFIDRPY